MPVEPTPPLSPRASMAAAVSVNPLVGFRLVPVTKDNFDALWSDESKRGIATLTGPEDRSAGMMPEQALAHETDLTGTIEEFKASLLDEDGVSEGFILETTDGVPVAYAIISTSHGPDGPTIYLEDVFTTPEYRKALRDENGEFVTTPGKFLYDFTALLAEARGAKTVTCTVDAKNPLANRFYVRCGAVKLPEPVIGVTIDSMTNVKGGIHIRADEADASGAVPETIVAGASLDTSSSVRLVEPEDIERLRFDLAGQDTVSVGSHSVDKDAFISSLKAATKHEKNFVVGSFNEAGELRSATFFNTTFSTFSMRERSDGEPTVSIQGEMPSPSDILSHAAFAERFRPDNKVQLLLDPKVIADGGMAEVTDIRAARMTPEDDTSTEHHYIWDVEGRP